MYLYISVQDLAIRAGSNESLDSKVVKLSAVAPSGFTRHIFTGPLPITVEPAYNELLLIQKVLTIRVHYTMFV